MIDLILESDEYCPHCDNKYVLDAVTKQDKWLDGGVIKWVIYMFYSCMNSLFVKKFFNIWVKINYSLLLDR